MEWRKESDGRILVYLAYGEKLRSSLEQLVDELQIDCAKITGIGALRDPQLGCFSFETKQYTKDILPGLWELLAINGNVSLVEGKRFLHLHVTMADAQYNVKGGHFFEGTIGVMAEIFIEPCQKPLHRAIAPATGLWAWSPNK